MHSKMIQSLSSLIVPRMAEKQISDTLLRSLLALEHQK